jgi:hypothetical protein
MVEKDEKVGSAEIARKLAIEFGLRVSAGTVRKALNKNGFQYGLPKRVLAHKPVQRVKRRNCLVKHRKTEKLAFGKVMFTDSKIFSLNPSAETCSARHGMPLANVPLSVIQAVQGGACVHGSHCLWRD